jgi:hypothetical protein
MLHLSIEKNPGEKIGTEAGLSASQVAQYKSV